MKQLSTALLQAAEMEARLTDASVNEGLKHQLTLWGAGIFRLVVMGEIKKGKSSFINAMLGEEDLVPVSSDVATSTIYKIRYGKEKGYRVHFANGNEAFTIPADELKLYGTEDGNPGNEKQVKFIEVIHPSPILKSGIVIIDTPGLGGLFKHHKQITYEYVPRADAVFFVTDSVESPIGALELEYINDIRNITPHLYFVQTKCNAVDKEARLARQSNNLGILSKALRCPAEKIPYFLLDSRARFRAERKQDLDKLNLSGYPQLMRFINHTLQGNQHKLLAARALVQTRPILEHVSELIGSRLEVLQAQTEEEKRTLSANLQEAQDALKNWQEEEQPRILNELQSGLQRIRLRAMEQCGHCRPNGEVQIEFDRKIHACKNVKVLQGVLKEIETKLPDYTAEVAYATSEQIKKEVAALLSELFPRCDTEAIENTRGEASSATLNTEALGRLSETISQFSTFETLKTGVYGGIAGGAIAYTAGAIVCYVIPAAIPLVGTFLTSTVGTGAISVWGAYQAGSSKAQQELKGAKQQAVMAVGQAMSSVYAKIQSSVEKLLLEINSRTSTALRDAMRQRMNELTKQMEDLRNTGKADAKAIEEKRTALLKERAQLAAILKVVKSKQSPAPDAA